MRGGAGPTLYPALNFCLFGNSREAGIWWGLKPPPLPVQPKREENDTSKCHTCFSFFKFHLCVCACSSPPPPSVCLYICVRSVRYDGSDFSAHLAGRFNKTHRNIWSRRVYLQVYKRKLSTSIRNNHKTTLMSLPTCCHAYFSWLVKCFNYLLLKFKTSSHFTLHLCLSFQYVHYDVERPRGDSKSDVSTTLMKKGLGGEVTMIPPQVKIKKLCG